MRTYVSLFSSAGVGCYGFKVEGYNCVVTNEYHENRLEIQKLNKKCKNASGYVVGDIRREEVKERILGEVERYKRDENLIDIDVVVATPPCQGMSVLNLKKNAGDKDRNSLVLEAIGLVREIQPRVFVFENVRAFMRTACSYKGDYVEIGEVIEKELGVAYEYKAKTLNFREYGSNSSRTRTLVIGIRKDIQGEVKVEDLYPEEADPKTLREVIGGLPRLKEMGEISEGDSLHSFREYAEHMREWIKDVPEGKSAFDNEEDSKKPHKLVEGKIVLNKNNVSGKYKRLAWDEVAPCIMTRNDIMSSQRTIHPEDDRVLSIRELMMLMTIPETFKWFDLNLEELDKLGNEEKKAYLKKYDRNIRTCIGEAVPTLIFSQIGKNIINQADKFDKVDYLS